MIFLTEMVFKLLGLGFKLYLYQNENIFDMVIVILSTADLVIYFYSKDEGHSEADHFGPKNIIQVFRIFRLLRVFKLARSWESFNFFLQTIANTLAKVSSFTVLLGIFIFMYAMVGLELFAHKMRFNRDNESVPYFDPIDEKITSKRFSRPDSNFDSFSNALLSVFIVIANDGWTVLYWDHYRTAGPVTSTVFFVSLVILG